MRQPLKAKQRKTRAQLNEEGRERKRQKKHRGHAAGSRINVSEQASKSGKAANVKDVRIGSKKPVELVISSQDRPKATAQLKSPAVQERLAPEKELSLLENDERLDALLERLEKGERLTNDEHKYVDKMLNRIDELMALLGIELDDEANDGLAAKQPDIMQLLKQKD